MATQGVGIVAKVGDLATGPVAGGIRITPISTTFDSIAREPGRRAKSAHLRLQNTINRHNPAVLLRRSNSLVEFFHSFLDKGTMIYPRRLC
jgi:hypothetical protein